MKLASISFTSNGTRWNRQITDRLVREGIHCSPCAVSRFAGRYGVPPLTEPLALWTKRQFEQADAILFIGACGIAVRSIAPYVTDKKTDPAVLVMDESARFVISLLSGHIGGANALAGRIAGLTGAQPVITTATDVNHAFAVDVFAVKNGLHIGNMNYAKEIAAALLEGQPVGFQSDVPAKGPWPKNLIADGKPELGVLVSIYRKEAPFLKTLRLTPAVVSVGVGCKKGAPPEAVEKRILEALEGNQIALASLKQIGSIDLKKEEEGILEFCRKYRLPFSTYSAGELLEAPGDFTGSDFVKSITGVDNVCERAAVLASNNGTIIQKKIGGGGVTVALALEEWSVRFE